MAHQASFGAHRAGGERATRDDAKRWIRANQAGRRNLNESQRAMLAAGLANLGEGRPSETASIEAVSQAEAAEIFNVSRSAVQRAAKVHAEAAPELVEAVQEGRVSVSVAAIDAPLASRSSRSRPSRSWRGADARCR